MFYLIYYSSAIFLYASKKIIFFKRSKFYVTSYVSKTFTFLKRVYLKDIKTFYLRCVWQGSGYAFAAILLYMLQIYVTCLTGFWVRVCYFFMCWQKLYFFKKQHVRVTVFYTTNLAYPLTFLMTYKKKEVFYCIF